MNGILESVFRLSGIVYHPKTGLFFREKDGSRADCLTVNGYRRVNIGGTRMYAHRAAWLMVHGGAIPETIDHINSDRADNRLDNLRPATRHEQQGNRRTLMSAKSGAKGVVLNPKTGTYYARIKHNDKIKHIGTFSSLEEASKAYMEEARKHFGDFAKEHVYGA